MHKIKTIERNEQLSCQNKLDSLSALCSKEMALKILRKAFKKGYNKRVSHLQEHFFEWLKVVTETILTCIITRTHEANLHIGIINEVFFRKI